MGLSPNTTKHHVNYWWSSPQISAGDPSKVLHTSALAELLARRDVNS